MYLKYQEEVRSGNKNFRAFHVQMVFKATRLKDHHLERKQNLIREKGIGKSLEDLQCLGTKQKRN